MKFPKEDSIYMPFMFWIKCQHKKDQVNISNNSQLKEGISFTAKFVLNSHPTLKRTLSSCSRKRRKQKQQKESYTVHSSVYKKKKERKKMRVTHFPICSPPSAQTQKAFPTFSLPTPKNRRKSQTPLSNAETTPFSSENDSHNPTHHSPPKLMLFFHSLSSSPSASSLFMFQSFNYFQ